MSQVGKLKDLRGYGGEIIAPKVQGVQGGPARDRTEDLFVLRSVRCHTGWPDGLSLDTDGRIHGTPRTGGCFNMVVEVTDSTVSPQHGGPQRFARRLRIEVARRPH